jgi:initiation factor 1A
MPNMKGGKNYKKMKHAQDVAPELHEIGPGQQIGRVLRLLGDRQLSIYCNDNIERICRIRGKLHKRVWINTGDIVLVSRRDFTAPDSDDSDDGVIDHKKTGLKPGTERGDVLAKYDPAVYSKLRKMDGINYHIFNTLETIDMSKIAKKVSGNFNTDENDDGFIFDAEAETKEEQEDSEAEDVKKVPWKRSLKKIDEMKDEDVNIDEI